MEQYEKDDFLMYLIESLKEFQEYQNQCKERERKIDDYKNKCLFSPQFLPIPKACEPDYNTYRARRKKSLITFNDIIRYIEDLPIERIEDAKCIQLMLFEIAGGKCDEEQYDRITNSVKKKKTPPTMVNLNAAGSQYVETINKQTNNYGRKRKKSN